MTEKCPDCGNPNLQSDRDRFDPLSGLMKKTKKCTQCRRWMFDE